MATFTSQIFEILTLNGDNVGSSVTQTINDKLDEQLFLTLRQSMF